MINRVSKFLPMLGLIGLLSACDDDSPTELPLAAPTNVTAVANGPTSVTLAFGAASGATSYTVERAGATGAFTSVGTTAQAGYTDVTVTPATQYRYRVQSTAGTRVSVFSTEVAVTTPAAGPKVAVINADITSSRTLYADTVYTLRGFIHVANNATLTIQPGTRIEGDFNTLGSSLFIMRGAKIMACGTAQAPIVFTSSQAVNDRKPGDWGGLILVGNARINRSNPTIEGTNTGPTNPPINYGNGTNDGDSSGELCYVRVEFAGFAPSSGAELNSFTFAAVGSGTKVEYLQAMSGLDDNYEWFGGTVDSKYLVSYESGDDHFDASEGYRGRSQFMIAYQSKILIPRTGAGSVSGDPQGIENDGCDGPGCTDGKNSQPFTVPMWTNFTLVGTGQGVVDATAGGYGVLIRRGAGGFYLNGIVARWPKAAIAVRDAETTARFTAGEMLISNILAAENGRLLQDGQQAYDTTATNVRSVATSAASLFNLLPTDPTSGAQFDWGLPANSPAATGGLTTFPAAAAAKAGTFITPTSYRGAAAPGGPKWWQGWTIYADN